MDHIAKEISFSDNSARGIVLAPSGGVYLAPYAGNGVRNLHTGTIHGRSGAGAKADIATRNTSQ